MYEKIEDATGHFLAQIKLKFVKYNLLPGTLTLLFINCPESMFFKNLCVIGFPPPPTHTLTQSKFGTTGRPVPLALRKSQKRSATTIAKNML